MWSWWDSLESIAKFDSFITMLRITGVMLAAVGSILAAVGTGIQWWSGARLNLLKAQLDEARQAEFREALAKSQQQAAAAEQALRDVRQQQRARTLSEEQRRTLIEQLQAGPKGKVTVNSTAGDPESMQFTDQLAGVLKMVGWIVDPVKPQLQGVSFMGIGLEMNPATSPHGELLQRALHTIGINNLVKKTDSRSEVVHLIVGPKPQPRQ